MKFKTRKTAVAAMVGTALFCSPYIASAQEADVESEQEAKKDVELILVTGSFVRRSENFESPSPLAVVDSVAIDAIGAKKYCGYYTNPSY
jgi:hypothetical protein